MQVRQYVIQKIADPVHEAYENKFSGQQTAGWKSPRQAYLRALLNIGAFDDIEIMVSALALWQYALKIAKMRRGNEDLQLLPMLRVKLEQEIVELEQVIKQKSSRDIIASRLSNILYYSVQIYTHDGDLPSFVQSVERYCSMSNIPPATAFLCAVAKFKNRSSKEIKDVPLEQRDIKRVLKEAQN